MPEDSRFPAILLLGPTGSGKTPLGQLAESRGLWGRRCVHFDFGAAMRAHADGGSPPGFLTRGELACLEGVLEGGALLEDEQFPLARKILVRFLTDRDAGPETLVVLNGLPRHVGQAVALEPTVRVTAVVHLACEAEVVLRRIRGDTGGDRAVRTDDGLDAVRRRITVYEQRTVPLLEHYRARGVPILRVDVAADTGAQETLRYWEQNRPDAPPGQPDA